MIFGLWIADCGLRIGLVSTWVLVIEYWVMLQIVCEGAKLVNDGLKDGEKNVIG